MPFFFRKRKTKGNNWVEGFDNRQTGMAGEEIAVKYLKDTGHKILDKNFSVRLNSLGLGEVDIVAKKQNTIIFCEVKTLKNPYFFPEDKVNFQKREKIRKVAEIWLNRHKIPFDSKWQIDIISVILQEGVKPEITHFKNI